MKKILLLSCLLLLIMLAPSCNKDSSSADMGSNTGVGGSTARMTISGNYLYVATNLNLYTYDISEPDKPVLLNSIGTGGVVETIFPFRDKLFLGGQQGMYVYDLSNPKSPKLQGSAQHFRACDPVVADESFAYVTLRNTNAGCGGTLNQLNVYNIEGNNILSPKLLSQTPLPEPNGLGFKGNILYVCCGQNGLNIVDITDKTKPKILNSITDENYVDVIPYNDLLIAYVKGGLVLYDITDAANPKKLSAIKS